MTKHQNITNPATNVKMPIKMPINFNAPITVNVNLTYNGGAVEPDGVLEKVLGKPAETRTTDATPAPIKPANNIPEEWKHVESRYGLSEAEIENRIFDKIVEKFKVRRSSLVSITPFVSAYKMYAVGTTGDVTYLAWVHPAGQIFVQQQCW